MTELVNDSPIVDHTPSEEVAPEVVEVKAEAAPAESPESAAPPVEDTASTTDEKPPESKPVEKTFTQAELDDILQKRLAKEHRKLERQARLEVENEYLRKQQSQSQPQAEPVQDAGSGEPRPESFQTYEDYIDAVTDWKVEQKLDAKLRGLQEQSQERKRAEAQANHEAAIVKNLSKAAEKYDDFHEVLSSADDISITEAMRDAIGDSEIGGEIAYYLANHADEAKAIYEMSPLRQIKEIDRLEQKLKAPAPAPEIAPVSQAPKPIEPVRGVKTGAVKLETADMDEYLKMRKQQGAKWA